MRLDKYLCHTLELSRRDVHRLLADKKITVNNQICMRKDTVINEEKDRIAYEGRELLYRFFHYIMLNKPQGVVCAVRDSKFPTINQIIGDHKNLHPIGRLDKDTEGLVIMTNNGSLTHALTNPNKDVVKTYVVYLKSPIEEDYSAQLEKGLDLYDGKGKPYRSKPAKLIRLEADKCLVEITEGKYHQVKKMFLKLGNEVIYLKRLAIGSICLDDKLEVGQFRSLTDQEINQLKGIG